MIPGCIKDLQKSVKVTLSGNEGDVMMAIATLQRVTGLEVAHATDIKVDTTTMVTARLRFVPGDGATVEEGEIVARTLRT
jgi:hypothetical protein